MYFYLDSIRLIRKELQDKLTGADIVKYEKATYVPFHIKMESENKILFYPSSKPGILFVMLDLINIYESFKSEKSSGEKNAYMDMKHSE